MGHIGYTPQFKKKFKVEGFTPNQEKELINEAIKIEKAGAFSIVLECIYSKCAEKITKKLTIPTIGIALTKLPMGNKPLCKKGERSIITERIKAEPHP